MALGKGGSEHHIPRAVLETLDSVVAPSVRDSLLQAALEESAEAELPSDPDRLLEFAQGPLRHALERGLGAELAETLTEEIMRMVDAAASSRPARRGSRSSSKPRTVSTPPRRPSPLPRSLTPPSVPPRRSQSPRPATLRSLARGLPTPPPHSGEKSKTSRSVLADDAPELEVSDMLSEVDFEDLPGLSESAPPIDDPLAHSDSARPLADLFPPPRGGTDPNPRKLRLGSSPTERPAQPHDPEDDTPWSSAEYPSTLARSIGMPGAAPSSRPGRLLPHVLVATRDPAMLRKMSVWLDPRAAVMRVRSVMDLLHRLEDAAHAPSVIVLDCRQPSVRPLALAALAEELPLSTHVVLVAATPELVRKLADIAPSSSGWLALSGAVRPKELAARCVELVS